MAMNKNSKQNRNDQSGDNENGVNRKPEKAANKPASLNGINKQLP